MELEVYLTDTMRYRWRIIDPSLKGSKRFIGSSNQPFDSHADAVANFKAVRAGAAKAKIPSVKRKPAPKKKAAKKKAPAKRKAAPKKKKAAAKRK